MVVTVFTRRLGSALGVRPGVLRVVETVTTAALVVALNLVTGVIAARLLGPEGRGELASILLALQVAGPLAVVGLPAACIYTLKKNPDLRPEIVGAALLLAVLGGLLASAVAWLAIPLWLGDYSPRIVFAAQVATSLAAFWTLMNVALPIIRAQDEFDVFNAVRVLTPALTLVCLLAMLAEDVVSPLIVAVPYALSTCLFVLWPLAWIVRRSRPRLRGFSRAAGMLLRYAGRSFAIDFVHVLSRSLDRLVIVAVLSPAAVGLYVVAVNMARPLQEFGTAITLVVFPKASGYAAAAAIETSALAARLGLFATASVGLVLAVVAPMLLGVLFGAEFLPAVPVFRLMLVAVILGSTADMLAQAFMATGRPGTVSLLRCLEMAILVTLLALLVGDHGMLGAAWAITAAATVRFAGVLACFPLVLRMPPPRLWIDVADVRRMRTARRPG